MVLLSLFYAPADLCRFFPKSTPNNMRMKEKQHQIKGKHHSYRAQVTINSKLTYMRRGDTAQN